MAVLALAALGGLQSAPATTITYYTESPPAGSPGPTEDAGDGQSYGTVYYYGYTSAFLDSAPAQLSIDTPSTRSYVDPSVGGFSQQGFDLGTSISQYAHGVPPEEEDVYTLLSSNTYYAPAPSPGDTVTFGYLGPNGPRPPGPPTHPNLPAGQDAYTFALGGNTFAETDAGFFNAPADAGITFTLGGTYNSTTTAKLDGQSITLTGNGTFTTPILLVAGNVNVTSGTIHGDQFFVDDASNTAATTTTLTLDGASAKLEAPTFLTAGFATTGASTLILKNGASATTGPVYLGTGGAGSMGVLTLDNGTLTATSFLQVGEAADSQGQVTVKNGGQLTTTDSAIGFGGGANASTVTVDGAGSKWTAQGFIEVGANGPGGVTHQLIVRNGAEVTTENYLVVGGVSGNSTGTGGLSILSGGKVTSGTTLGSPTLAAAVGFGDNSTGTATIDGAGSTWDIKQRLNIGYGAGSIGTVTVQNGGTLQVEGDIIRVGRLTGSTGTLTFDGSGGNTPVFTFTGGSESQLIIGDAGTGYFNAINGAEISSDSQVIIGNQAAVAGSGATANPARPHFQQRQRRLAAAGTPAGVGSAVVGTGALWNIGDDLIVGAGGAGTLTISGNASVTNQAAIVGRDAGSQGTVTLGDTGSIWHSNKDLTIGQSGTGSVTVQNAATLRVDGDLTLGTNANAVGTLTFDGFNTSLVYGGGDVAIGSAGTGTLTAQNGALVNLSGTSVTLGDMTGGVGTLNVTGADSTFHSGDLTVGGTGMGTVYVDTGGTLISGDTTFGDEDNSTGTGTVDGSGSSWTVSSLTVGGSGTGELDIQNGGSVTVGNGGELTIGDEKSGNGTLTLSDVGSALHFNGEINVGENGTGVFAVQGGASFTAFKVNVGDKGTGNGTLNVDGAGTRVEVQQDFNVGEQGTGALNVTGGAHLLNDSDATLADLTGSTGTATVDTSAVWTVAGSLSVGHQGIGGLQVSNGAFVSAQNITLGEIAGGAGTATVSGRDANGSSTLQFDGLLKVGDAGHGELDVQNGGLVTPSGHGTGADAGSVEVASQAGSVGRISVDGSGSYFEAVNLAVGGTNAAPGGAGTFVLTNGGTAHVAASLHVWGSVNVQGGGFTLGSAADPAASGTLRLNAGGTLAGSGTIVGNVVNAGGTVAPGDPRTLTINGNYEQDSGAVLQIAIGGSAATDYDHVMIGGEASLEHGSVLDLVFINGYAPQKGALFDFLSVGSLDAANDAFSTVNITGLAPGFAYSLMPDPDNPSDYDLLALNDGIAGVPEPRTLPLVALGIMAWLSGRKVRRSDPARECWATRSTRRCRRSQTN